MLLMYFEYFDRNDVINVLNEWRRVLKPVILRLAVPNFQNLIEVYQLSNDLSSIILYMVNGTLEIKNLFIIKLFTIKTR